MALPSTIQDRDFRNFKDNGDNTSSRYVHVVNPSTGDTSGSILAGVEFDEIAASYPNSTTEVYVYKLATVTQATITVVYTNASKDLVSSVVKT